MDFQADSSGTVAEHGGREQNQITKLSARRPLFSQACGTIEECRDGLAATQHKVVMTAPRLGAMVAEGRLNECCTEGKGRAGAKEISC